MAIDLGSMAALKSSLDSAIAILKAMVGLRDAAIIQDKVIELQGVILSAQSSALAANTAQFALLERVRDLEQEIVQLKDWEREKQRYQLNSIGRGAFAYMPKPGMEDGEPPHWLCANCFNRRQKSFLQFKGQDRIQSGSRSEHSTYGCDTCNALIKVAYTTAPSKF
jgi:hypothetical protein